MVHQKINVSVGHGRHTGKSLMTKVLPGRHCVEKQHVVNPPQMVHMCRKRKVMTRNGISSRFVQSTMDQNSTGKQLQSRIQQRSHRLIGVKRVRRKIRNEGIKHENDRSALQNSGCRKCSVCILSKLKAAKVHLGGLLRCSELPRESSNNKEGFGIIYISYERGENQ